MGTGHSGVIGKLVLSPVVEAPTPGIEPASVRSTEGFLAKEWVWKRETAILTHAQVSVLVSAQFLTIT